MLLSVEMPLCPIPLFNISGGSCPPPDMGFGDGVFSPPLSWGASPRLLGEVTPTRCQQTVWSGGGTCLPGELGWGSGMHNGTQRGAGPVRGAPPARLIRTRVQILGLSLSGTRRAWSPPGVTWVALSNSKTVTSRHWKWGRNIGCLDVNMCEWEGGWLQSKYWVLICRSVSQSVGP
jgi:hypothetical protein